MGHFNALAAHRDSFDPKPPPPGEDTRFEFVEFQQVMDSG